MNKKFVTKLTWLKSMLATLLLVSTNAFSHPGHLDSYYAQGIHSFLHIEHIVAIVGTLAVICGAMVFRGK